MCLHIETKMTEIVSTKLPIKLKTIEWQTEQFVSFFALLCPSVETFLPISSFHFIKVTETYCYKTDFSSKAVGCRCYFSFIIGHKNLLPVDVLAADKTCCTEREYSVSKRVLMGFSRILVSTYIYIVEFLWIHNTTWVVHKSRPGAPMHYDNHTFTLRQ